ncbi:hypothetical protein SCHPADRAFT_909245 [Schizopora paradoxa]|uniref:CCHC-type domain-containing protein n=1 Tax=Schizopora paradoxa TaxID=27342 RepID=A0A0H2R796_9AGAM|nr:hypothetical protein SCHPADRAFT_909245 [Schizopora paradoxa]
MSNTSDRQVRQLHRQIRQLQRDNVGLVSQITLLQHLALEHGTIVSPVHASPSSELSSLPPLTPSPPASPTQPSAHPMANLNANVQAISDFAGDEAPPGPTKWMQSIRIAFGPGITNEDALFFFELKLVHGKPAKAWFDTLPAQQKDTWQHLRTAFDERWPPSSAPSSQVAVLRDRLERDVLTEEEALREEDNTYGYVRWVRRVRQIARELEDPQHHLLAGVVNKLPYPIYRSLPVGSQATWDLFEAAITDLPLRAVEGSFVEMRAQQSMREWAKHPVPSTGATAFWQGFGRGRGAGNLFPRPPATPFSPTPPRPQQQQQPIMLTPGTAPLGSRECWSCGQQGHTRFDCPNPNQISAEEQQLRRQAGQAAQARARQVHQLSAYPLEYFYPDASSWTSGNE